MEKIYYPQLNETLYRDTLSNGLSILVCPRPGFQRKLAYFVTDFGSIHTHFTMDGQPHTVPAGIAHYLEHKLFELPDRDVTAEFAALGAVPNAFTSYDMTAYHFTCTEHFEESLSLLLEFVSTPWFTRESVQKEQGIIGQEIDMVADSPDTKVFELLMEAMYENHPIRVPILGDRSSISRITPENLTLCHKAFYRPGNMLLCVVGDVDPEAVRHIALQQLSAHSGPTVDMPRSWQETMTCPRAYTEAEMEVSMPMFQLGFKCEPTGLGEEAVRQETIGDLAAELLFGEASPLYLRLYEEGLIDTSFGGGFETIEGMAMLTASGDSEDPQAVRDAILAQVAVLLEKGIDPQDFLRAKRSALGRRLRGLDSFDSTAFRLCAYHLSDFDYFRFPEVYRQITEQEILDFLRRVVTRERMSLCVIHPIKEVSHE